MPQETYSYDGESDFNSPDIHEDAMPDKREFDDITGEELPVHPNTPRAATSYNLNEFDLEERRHAGAGRSDAVMLEVPSDMLMEKKRCFIVRIPYYMDIITDSGKNLRGANFVIGKSNVTASLESPDRAGVQMAWLTLGRQVRLTKYDKSKKAVFDLDGSPIPKSTVTDTSGMPVLDSDGKPKMEWDYNKGTVLPATEVEKALRATFIEIPKKYVTKPNFEKNKQARDYNWVRTLPGTRTPDGKDISGYKMISYFCADAPGRIDSEMSVWIPRGANVEFTKYDNAQKKVVDHVSLPSRDIARCYDTSEMTIPKSLFLTYKNGGYSIRVPQHLKGDGGVDLTGCLIPEKCVCDSRPAKNPEFRKVILTPEVEINRLKRNSETGSWIRLDAQGNEMQKVEGEYNGEKRLVWPSPTYVLAASRIAEQVDYVPVDVPGNLARLNEKGFAVVSIPAGCVDENGANIAGWTFIADAGVENEDDSKQVFVNSAAETDVNIMRKTENGMKRYDPQGNEIPHLLDDEGNEIEGKYARSSATLRGSEIVAAFDDFAERSGHAATQVSDSPELEREAVKAKSVDTDRPAPEQDNRPRAL